MDMKKGDDKVGECDIEPERDFVKVGEHILIIEKVDICDNDECSIYISELPSDVDIKEFRDEDFNPINKDKIRHIGFWGYDGLLFNPTDFITYYLDMCEYVLEDYLSEKETKEALRKLRKLIRGK